MQRAVFTGIVEELGEVTEVRRQEESARLRIAGPLVSADAAHGDSIAVNGVCLTVVDPGIGSFTTDVMYETLRRSSLAGMAQGTAVNLERSLELGRRLGGHIVQGHVDGTGSLLQRSPGEGWDLLRFSLPPELARYVADKGSIAVDGVSLTVSGVGPDWFDVGLIPTTLAETTLGRTVVGDVVNLETDVLARYLERLCAPTGLAGGSDPTGPDPTGPHAGGTMEPRRMP